MSDFEDSQFGGGAIPAFVQHMMDNAIPIWQVFNMTEEKYIEKYVKPFVHKVCDVVEEIAEEIVEVVQSVEKIVGIDSCVDDVAQVVLEIAEIIEEAVECKSDGYKSDASDDNI